MIMKLLGVLIFAVAGVPAMAQISVGVEPPTSGNILVPYNQAVDALRKGEYAEALKGFSLAVRLSDGSALPSKLDEAYGRAGMAWVAMLRGQLQEAYEIQERLQASLDIAAIGLDNRVDAATLDLVAGLPERAQAKLAEVARGSAPKTANALSIRQAWNLLAEAALDRNDVAGAETAHSKAMELWAGQRLRAWNARMVRARLDRTASRIQRAKGNYAEAENLARAALDAHLKDQAEESWDGIQDDFEMAQALHGEKKYEQAEVYYQRSYRYIKERLDLRQPLARKIAERYLAMLDETGRDTDAVRVRKTIEALPRAVVRQ
jgi:hypothetical protein